MTSRAPAQGDKGTQAEDSDEDEFFDAQDYFDQEILDMLNLDKNTQAQPDGRAVN